MTAVAEPAPARTTHRSPDRLVLLGVAAVALAAWLSVTISGNGAVGAIVFAGAFAVGSAVAPGLRLHRGTAHDVPDGATLGERVEELALPGKPLWYLPFALLPIMLVLTPIAYAATSFHNSILFLAAATALMAGTLGTIVGSRLWSGVLVAVTAAPKALEEATTQVSARTGALVSVVLGALLAIATVVGAILV